MFGDRILAASASHISQSSQQLPWDQHVAISYLLGLDWSVSQSFQELREQEKTIKELKRSARQGTLPGFRGSAASLRTQVTLAESKARQLRQQLDAFNVVPEYESIEREATELTRDMNRHGNENTADRQFLDQLRSALEDERAPEVGDLEALYCEVGIVLPELVTRHLNEATEFHWAIIENRKAHLRLEIDRAPAPNLGAGRREGSHGGATGRADGNTPREAARLTSVHFFRKSIHGCGRTQRR